MLGAWIHRVRRYHGCSCYAWVEGMLRLRRGGSQARARTVSAHRVSGSAHPLPPSSLSSLPPLPSLLPSFFSSSPTNPSFLFQIITPALGMLGCKYVHIYEKWSWIPSAIAFFVILGCAAKHLVNLPMGREWFFFC